MCDHNTCVSLWSESKPGRPIKNEDDTVGLGHLVAFPDVMLSPPRKEKDPDPDAPDTGLSVLSDISAFLNSNSEDSVNLLQSLGAAMDTKESLDTAKPLSIEEEGMLCRPDGEIGSHDPRTTLTNLVGTGPHIMNLASVNSSTNLVGGEPPVAMPPPQVVMPQVAMHPPQVVMAGAEVMELPAASQEGSKRVTSKQKLPSYQVVDGLIVLSNPERVTAPDRIRIVMLVFGATNKGKAWTREDVGYKYKDMVGHEKTCLVHNLKIKSGSSWHCKGVGVPVCSPCQVLKVLKQIGTTMHKFTEGKNLGHQGGIPRMILDLATFLHLDSVDYRDLKLIFQAVTDLGGDMTSCNALWAACLQNSDEKYLVANKRFYGCLMQPQVGHRPKMDKVEFSASKGLANLWHETVIWKNGKYLTFTQKNRYLKNVSNTEERSAYQSEVIVSSVTHVSRIRSDGIELARASWQELQVARDKLLSGHTSGKKRKYNDEKKEEE